MGRLPSLFLASSPEIGGRRYAGVSPLRKSLAVHHLCSSMFSIKWTFVRFPSVLAKHVEEGAVRVLASSWHRRHEEVQEPSGRIDPLINGRRGAGEVATEEENSLEPIG